MEMASARCAYRAIRAFNRALRCRTFACGVRAKGRWVTSTSSRTFQIARPVISSEVSPNASLDGDDYKYPELDEESQPEIPFEPLQPMGYKKDKVAALLLGFFGIGAAAVFASYTLHPRLIDLVIDGWHLNPATEDTGFETNVFSLLSILYAILFGNTFTFLYTRQERLVQEMYEEALCLELVLEETFLADSRVEDRTMVVAELRKYVKNELYNPLDMHSPFQAGSPFTSIVRTVRRIGADGVEINGVMAACNRLAEAQSRRSAAASQILPLFHWVFLYLIMTSLIVTFLIFEAADGSFESRRLIFAAMCGLLFMTSAALEDLAEPLTGLYTFRDQLDARLKYVCQALDSYMLSKVLEGLDCGNVEGEDSQPGSEFSLALHADPNSAKRRRNRRRMKSSL